MALISLICCLLAVSSSAFARSSFSSYGTAFPQTGMRDLPIQSKPLPQIPTGYSQYQANLPSKLPVNLQEDVQQSLPVPTPVPSGYGVPQWPQKPESVPQFERTMLSGYGTPQMSLPAPVVPTHPKQLLLEQQQLLQKKIQESQVFTEADIACRGQRPEAIIPLEDGHRFVVCLDEGKGYIQSCGRLYYHTETRRCERKLGPLGNPCDSQPCLNGGQCVQTDVSSFECRCQSDFDGKICELDARACRSNPCGQSPDTRCQSFRFGAALQYICIFQKGQAYGLNSQQIQSNPCRGVDGTKPLGITDKGFIMCDGESMYVESCPGGTVWDDNTVGCLWPDMKDVIPTPFEDQSQGYSQKSYSQMPISSAPIVKSFEQPLSYNQVPVKSFEQPSSYNQVPVKSYDSRVPQEEKMQSFPTRQYDTRVPQEEKIQSFPTRQYASPVPVQQYASSIPQQEKILPEPQKWQQPIHRQHDRPVPQQFSSPY